MLRRGPSAGSRITYILAAMKLLLLPFLLAATPALAQYPASPPTEAGSAQLFKGATAVIINSQDSAQATYSKMVAGLLAQGYAIDRNDKDVLFFSSTSRAVDGSVFIKIQAVVTPANGGSKAVFRSTFTWVSATTIMAHVENRELPAQFAGGDNGPSKRAWVAMQRAALASLPAGSVSYAKL